jgi:NAD(P)-dependent dehydrogenase (short-subunit alcohol dehydrogenase family)
MAPNNRKYTTKLANASVLVIGGTSGIGYGVAEALIENDVANLYISSSQQTRIDDAISRLKSTYPDETTTTTNIIGLPAVDLADENNLESNIKALFEAIPPSSSGPSGTKVLDHIVFTSGDSLGIKPLDDVDMTFFKRCGMVRFFAPFFVAKYGRHYLKPGRGSSITLTTGGVSEKPIPNWSAIAPWMTGLHGMCRGLALELKPIRVNLVSPGAVATELWDASFTDPDAKQAAFAEFGKKMATGAIGRVEDVAESYLYAMKDKNVTGTVLRSDGGSFLL